MVTSLPSLTETHIDRDGNTTRMIQLQENTNGSSSTPISTFRGHEYDVFLGFRGEDTRSGFTNILYENLDDAGLLVYKDDVELQAGEDILPTLMEAIEKSKLSILIFSSDYASSKSCLQEVAKVKECREKRQQIVLPIFYKIEPSDVRGQRGPFKKSFRQHRKNKELSPHLIEQWEKALIEIGFLKGYPVWPNVNQGKLVKEIVSVVLERLRTSEVPVDSHLVGMEQRVEEVVEMLQGSPSDVRIVGICGMPGIGKTTLAKAVYNKLHRGFKGGCSFIPEIQKGDILSLQNQLISELSNGKFQRFDSFEENRKFISMKYEARKVLIVLDDVKDLHHLKAFCVNLQCFAPGSRIILTTQRPELLDEAKVEEKDRYIVKELSEPDALRLLHWHAFYKDSPEQEYRDLSAKIVCKTGGNPSMIQHVGSYLFSHRNTETRTRRWTEILQQLENCDVKPMCKLLKTVYDDLSKEEQQIYLDIACFLRGASYTIASYMWDDCKFYPINARNVLVGKSLLTIGENDKMDMNFSVSKYGQDLVEAEGTANLEMRSRLWIHKDSMEVLKGKKGSDKIQAMCLEFDNCLDECLTGMSRPTGIHDQVKTSRNFGYLQKFLNFLQSIKNITANLPIVLFSSGKMVEPSLLMAENFGSLSELRFLRLSRAKIRGDFRNFFPKLRWLDWKNCPEFLQEVQNLYLEKLVILDMSCSDVTNDWNGWNPIMEKAENLKVLLLVECKLLHESPSFPECRKLERINFEGCSRLRNISIPSSTIQTLVYLNLKGCSHITKLPEDLCSMKALETLIIDGTSIRKVSFGSKMQKLKELSACSCGKLKIIDDNINNLESLSHLSLDDTGIETLPVSINKLSKLGTLSLRNCKKFTELPATIGCLTSLVKMDLSDTAIRELPLGVQCLRSLRELVMENTYLSEFPVAILRLRSLERIDFTDCGSMRGNVPDGITSLCSLKILKLSATGISSLPTGISRLSQLQVLDLYRCEELELQDSMTWPHSLIFYRAGSHIPL